MPFRRLHPTDRASLLACDACDSVMAVDGTTSTQRLSSSDPSELAPHYDDTASLRAAAKSAGWSVAGDRWSCPTCAARAPLDAPR
jgi:hypothetical protein